MKKKYQNAFFVFGLVVLVIMLTQLDFKQVWEGLRHTGYWFFAVIGLWVVLYIFNTGAWYTIIRSQTTTEDGQKDTRHVKFWWLYKVTISGFALNYATPGGLMGGEPYRIMELAPKIGTARASSSVILYAMTHIFSHFWFWGIASLLYIFMRPMDFLMTVLLAVTIAFCSLGIWFFLSGYKKGLANRCMKLLSRMPLIKKWAKPFIDNHREQLDTVDRQIAALHNQNPRSFFCAVLLELGCRFCSALEIVFILFVLQEKVSYFDCVFILAFTSLFANMLFFMPLQLGGREGGFLMSTTKLGLAASQGIFLALIVRLRELVWTGIGLLLIKIGKEKRK